MTTSQSFLCDPLTRGTRTGSTPRSTPIVMPPPRGGYTVFSKGGLLMAKLEKLLPVSLLLCIFVGVRLLPE